MTTHQDYKLALQAFQSQRLRRDLADLASEAQYQQIGQFFFEEMYGARDFSARDEQAQHARWFVHQVPGVTAHDVEAVLDLLALTHQLDDDRRLVDCAWRAARLRRGDLRAGLSPG